MNHSSRLKSSGRDFAIIVAAGSGTRLGFDFPKAFCEIVGRSILAHSLAAFLEVIDVAHIVLVVPKGWEKAARERIATLESEVLPTGPNLTPIQVVTGGASRHESVRCGVASLESKFGLLRDDLIAIHDAARCLVDSKLIESCYAAADSQGAATAGSAIRDTVKRVRNRKIVAEEFISRDGLYAMQTPQVFRYELLQRAFGAPDAASSTDEVSLVQTFAPVQIVESCAVNLKITVPDDLAIAITFLEARAANQV